MSTNDHNRIGLRRLFDSRGCSISGREEVVVDFVVGESYQVQVYFGPKPHHGIQVTTGGDKYYVPGQNASFGTLEFKADATQSTHPGKLFVEVAASTLADPISADCPTEAIDNELLRQARARKDDFRNMIDLVAGIIGLRFHRQFVLEPLNENVLAWKGDIPIRGIGGPVLEILERVSLNENGIAYLEAKRAVLAALPVKTRRKLGLILHWLLRSWRERDPVYNFTALFIPLEAILTWVVKTDSSEDKQRAKAIRKLIRENAGNESEELLGFFERIAERAARSLDEKFVELAQAARLPGWEGDIEAFREFKRIRNALVHGSEKDVHEKLTIGDEEVRTLSDLVERYVNYAIFRDSNVYRSRWRPKIGVPQKPSSRQLNGNGGIA